MASGTLLASLRGQVLDEAQPPAGLLRRCLVLVQRPVRRRSGSGRARSSPATPKVSPCRSTEHLCRLQSRSTRSDQWALPRPRTDL